MELELIYQLVRERDQRINSYFSQLPPELEELFKSILTEMGADITEENLLILKRRFFHLREDSLQLLFDQLNFTPLETQRWQLKIYEQVREFWLKEHRQLIEKMSPHLSPFFRTLLEGIHKLGEVFSKWQPVWTSHIIHHINETLSLQFGGDEAKVMAYLLEEGLLDKGHFGEVGDRCYSVLVKEGESYRVESYSKFFKEEVEEGVAVLEELINQLKKVEGYEGDQKEDWIEYLTRLKEALAEEEVDRLVPKWAEVDRAWMEIKTPIQMGHPLEYYEDKYRKAVALELDVRVQNPELRSEVKESIIKMYQYFCGDPYLLQFGIENIERTQLYLSTPALFYGAELNGLFSAQVVPNDEVVSKEKGKKIFAFVEKVYNDFKARPKMALSYEIFGPEFMERFYKNMEDWELFFQIYDITTIGHEYGHILWVDQDTESKMNKTGMFKNGEEWKATTGGLVAFFLEERKELITPLLDDLIVRSVQLIRWMEVGEVLPYYIEGLIHLTGLFQTGLLQFKGERLEVDYSLYPELKKWYIDTYLKLADLYTRKGDSREFLEKFVEREGPVYLSKDGKTRRFVRHYYRRYKEIGAKIWKG